MNEERHDPEAAALHARTFPRKGLPHYLRCDWMRGAQRCLSGEAHIGDHVYPDAPSDILQSLGDNK